MPLPSAFLIMVDTSSPEIWLDTPTVNGELGCQLSTNWKHLLKLLSEMPGCAYDTEALSKGMHAYIPFGQILLLSHDWSDTAAIHKHKKPTHPDYDACL